jgi:hypothetical protein
MWGLAVTRALVLQLLLLRFLVGALVLLPRCRPVLRHLDRASLTRLIASGLLGMTG